MTMKIKANRIVFRAKGVVEMAAEDLPDALGPGEVLIRTSRSLISAGTELALFLDQNEMGERKANAYPMYPGYAAVGTVDAVGAGIEAFAVGDRIFAASPHASHSVFRPSRCFCMKLSDGISDEQAVFIRMSLITLAALCRADIRAGEWLGVVGLGIVGNLGAQFGGLAGYEVIAVGRSALRSERAAQCGIENIVSGEPSDVEEKTRAISNGEMCRFVLDTTGTSEGLLKAVHITATGGSVSLVGVPWRKDPAVDLSSITQPLFSRYLTIRGGWEWDLPLYREPKNTPSLMVPFRHSIEANAEHAHRAIAQGKIKTAPLVTHVIPPSRVQEAYDGLADKRNEYMGVIIDWEKL
jgi:threonine dehydrogenase-like Zn-dependent dehydrogenase